MDKLTFRTQVIPNRIQPFVNPSSMILSIGSCFADNMGGKLVDNCFNCSVNPFGVLYNPASISKILEIGQTGKPMSEDELSNDGENWFSYSVHGQFNNVRAEDCLTAINSAIDKTSEVLQKSNVLILTLGTSYVYRLKATGEVVANCHKQPQNLFTRELLDHDSAYTILGNQLNAVLKKAPDLQIILTVSPVRHLRDDPHENQISKSHLLILAQNLCDMNANIHYFPAYEIMMDDLRDYRFYADDMVHPAPLAIDTIWDAFKKWCFTKDAHKLVEQVQEIRQRQQHRPRNPESADHQQFLKKTETMIQELATAFPESPLRLLCGDAFDPEPLR